MTQSEATQDEYEQGAGPGAPIPVTQLVVSVNYMVMHAHRH